MSYELMGDERYFASSCPHLHFLLREYCEPLQHIAWVSFTIANREAQAYAGCVHGVNLLPLPLQHVMHMQQAAPIRTRAQLQTGSARSAYLLFSTSLR